MALVGKDELVHEVAERSGLGIGEARRALEETLKAIETQLGDGNEVRLTGFGKFSVSRRNAREGRNPQTGESMTIAAKKVPRFSAGAELKKAVPRAPHDGASESKSKKPSSGKGRPKTVRSKRKRAPREVGSAPGGKGSKGRAEAPRPDSDEPRPDQEQSEGTSDQALSEDGETSHSERKRAKRRPKTPRRSATKKRGAAPEDETAPDFSGADEEDSAETSAAGKAASVAASGAKFALVAAAGLAAGVAGGLAVMHRR